MLLDEKHQMQQKGKGKAIPATGHGGPQVVRRRGSHIFSRKSAHRWR
jgi:hypothetical protein